MTKATHNGTCQACGRQHAFNVKKEIIAKHGYTVEHGFFNGECSGGERKPLEHDRSYLDSFVKSLHVRSAELDERIVAGPEALTKVFVSVGGDRYPYKSTKKLVDREEFDKLKAESRRGYSYDWDQQARNRIFEFEQQAKWARSHADSLIELARRVHGQELTKREQPKKRTDHHFDTTGEAYRFHKQCQEEGKNSRVRSRTVYVYAD